MVKRIIIFLFIFIQSVNADECTYKTETITENGVIVSSKEIKGPKVGVDEGILNSFIKAHNISKKEVYEKENDKGIFYFMIKIVHNKSSF